MNKNIFLVLALFLTVLLIYLLLNDNLNSTGNVDPDLYKQFKTQDVIEVSVIIDGYNPEIKASILNSLNSTEFNLTREGNGWFSGLITKKGVDKLRKNKLVRRISIPGTVHTL